APDRAETCPERGGRARSAVVDVVVQEIPKRRHHSRVLGVVVVGAEERGELGLGVEGSADALEGIRMDDDIGVDEHEDLAGRPRSALVASRGRIAASSCASETTWTRRASAADTCAAAAGAKWFVYPGQESAWVPTR